jgi:hypothetical protein
MNVRPPAIRNDHSRCISEYNSALGITIAEMVNNRSVWTGVP